MAQETYVLVYSIEDKRPGCVLMQAALGGTVPDGLFAQLFPSETWITGGDRGLKPGAIGRLKKYVSTKAELERVAEITRLSMSRAR
jgi:hypothetical protein